MARIVGRHAEICRRVISPSAVNILVFKLSPLGDTVMFLPVVQELRRRLPGARITVVTTPAMVELWRHTVSPEDIWSVERVALQRCWRRPWVLVQWWLRVRRLHPDAVLLSFDQSSVARALALASGARVRVAGAGAVVRFRPGVTHEVERQPAQTIAEWDWAMAGTMAGAFGMEWRNGPVPAPTLGARGASSSHGRPRVVMHAGASRDYQHWLPDRFSALAERLGASCDVVWIDRPEIRATPPVGVDKQATSSLAALLAAIQSADLFVGYHSGPFHLAAAIGTPCVILAGPTHPAADPPWHRERVRILRAPGVACLPCDGVPIAPNRCTNLDEPMACMRYWSVEMVADICLQSLARFAAPSATQRRSRDRP